MKISDILISIHPRYAEKILKGEKTIELRRRFPKVKGRLSIYSTSPVKSVVGYAEIEDVHYLPLKDLWTEFKDKAGIKEIDFLDYFTGLTHGYGVQIKNPIRFRYPLHIDYLKQNYGIGAPQSHRYLNEKHEGLFHGFLYYEEFSDPETGYKCEIIRKFPNSSVLSGIIHSPFKGMKFTTGYLKTIDRVKDKCARIAKEIQDFDN